MGHDTEGGEFDFVTERLKAAVCRPEPLVATACQIKTQCLGQFQF